MEFLILVSVWIYMGCLDYQDAFFTPGIIPVEANSLKQMRQRPKSLI